MVFVQRCRGSLARRPVLNPSNDATRGYKTFAQHLDVIVVGDLFEGVC